MKKEQSYGVVVYKVDEGQVYYLIEHMVKGHVSIPKGHIEKGETPLECTLREIKEETNLDVDVDMNFSRTITYCPEPDVVKDVTFFIARAKTFDLKAQPEEITSLDWMLFADAYEALTYDTDKETLKEADDYLLK